MRKRCFMLNIIPYNHFNNYAHALTHSFTQSVSQSVSTPTPTITLSAACNSDKAAAAMLAWNLFHPGLLIRSFTLLRFTHSLISSLFVSSVAVFFAFADSTRSTTQAPPLGYAPVFIKHAHCAFPPYQLTCHSINHAHTHRFSR